MPSSCCKRLPGNGALTSEAGRRSLTDSLPDQWSACIKSYSISYNSTGVQKSRSRLRGCRMVPPGFVSKAAPFASKCCFPILCSPARPRRRRQPAPALCRAAEPERVVEGPAPADSLESASEPLLKPRWAPRPSRPHTPASRAKLSAVRGGRRRSLRRLVLTPSIQPLLQTRRAPPDAAAAEAGRDSFRRWQTGLRRCDEARPGTEAPSAQPRTPPSCLRRRPGPRPDAGRRTAALGGAGRQRGGSGERTLPAAVAAPGAGLDRPTAAGAPTPLCRNARLLP